MKLFAWKPIAAASLLGFLAVSVIGCDNTPKVAPTAPGATAGAPPQGVLDQMKNLPPEQQERIKKQMANSPQAGAINGAIGGSAGGSSSGSAGGGSK